jgi:hypothetical protein
MGANKYNCVTTRRVITSPPTPDTSNSAQAILPTEGNALDIGHIMYVEVLVFLALLSALLAYRMLTRQIALKGLLGSSLAPEQVSPERVQLLLATLFVSARYLREAMHSTGNALPDVSKTSLTIIGGSSGIYAAVKGFAMWQLKSQKD